MNRPALSLDHVHDPSRRRGRAPPTYVRPRRAWLLVAIFVAPAMAGCLVDDSPAPSPNGEAETTGGPHPSTSAGASDGAAAATDPNAVAAAERPSWTPGMRVRWAIESLATEPTTIETVVLSSASTGIEIGVADLDAHRVVAAYHIIPFGRLDATTLAWDAHGTPMALVDFPLTDGKTWTRDLWFGSDLAFAATLQDVDTPDGPQPGFHVTATLPDGTPGLAYWWSIPDETFVRIDVHFGLAAPFGSAHVVDITHGVSGSYGLIEVQDLLVARAHGPPALDPDESGWNAPLTFDAPGTSTHLLVACWLGGAPGTYRGALVAPDGAVTVCAPDADDGRLQMTHLTLADNGGAWHVGLLPGGEGQVLVEVMALTETMRPVEPVA